MNRVLYVTSEDRYASFEKQSTSKHLRQCIDNSVTGCNKCVGYCQFSEHPGFLTKELRKKHDCIKKHCNYYVPKSTKVKDADYKCNVVDTNEIENIVETKVKQFEGMKIMKIDKHSNEQWTFNYITISNDYPLTEISETIKNEFGFLINWNRLNYTFDNCIKLIFG